MAIGIFGGLMVCGVLLAIARLFGLTDPQYYLPTGILFREDPALITVHLITDIAIGTACYVFPLLGVVVYYYEYTIRTHRAPSAPYRWSVSILRRLQSQAGLSRIDRLRHIGIYYLAFIFFQGTGHYIDALTLWLAAPWASAAINTGTAITAWSALYVTASHVPYFIGLLQRITSIMDNTPRNWDSPT